jgi:hypothetical protein
VRELAQHCLGGLTALATTAYRVQELGRAVKAGE